MREALGDRLIGASAQLGGFWRPRPEPLEEKVLRRLLKRRRIPAVPHGFRSSFRDWAAEETEQRREVIEAALAHVVGNKVEAAYARSDLFERQRRLMGEWAAHLNALTERRTRRAADTVPAPRNTTSAHRDDRQS